MCDAMAEVISARSEMAELRRKCDTYEDAVEKFRRKAVALRKQNSDLTAVVKRFIIDSKDGEARNRAAVPMKITRSVGLTVNMVSTAVVADRRSLANGGKATLTPVSRTVVNTPVRGISQKSPQKRTSVVVTPQQANGTVTGSVRYSCTKACLFNVQI